MMTSRFLFCYLSLFLIWITISHALTEVIRTTSGPVQGTIVQFNSYRVKQYLGIPFAKPPINELRFRKPVAMTPWSKTLLADTMPPACLQYVEYPYPWYDPFPGMSEDCLYLNIWVPQSARNSTRKFPVIFWIYGGGFTIGSNRLPIYDGVTMASVGDVIVVTINYRMSALGFLTSYTKTAPGNVGIYDLMEALKWVNQNIDAFGGNSEQVTIAGESAGSIAVGLLCVSPLTTGLFNKVILESGSPAYLSAENNTANVDKSQRLAEALGCADEVVTIYDNPDKVVNCLRAKKASEIIQTENSFHPASTRSFTPNYGDEILPLNPRISLIRGIFHNANVLIGNVRDEGSFRLATYKPEVFGIFGINDPKINKTYGESLIRGMVKDIHAKDEVIQHYLGHLAENDYDAVREQVYTAIGDYALLCPTKYFAETYSRSGNDVHYFYFVSRPSSTLWAKWMKVAHFTEVEFVFGMPLKNPSMYSPSEIDLSSRMLKIWTNFVKYGSPQNSEYPGLPESNWPLYSRKYPFYIILGTSVRKTYGQGPHLRNCDFFRPYFGFQ